MPDLVRSFEVHRVDTGEDLSEDGRFDTMPTDEEIIERLAHRRPDWWMGRGCGTRFDARADTDPRGVLAKSYVPHPMNPVLGPRRSGSVTPH